MAFVSEVESVSVEKPSADIAEAEFVVELNVVPSIARVQVGVPDVMAAPVVALTILKAIIRAVDFWITADELRISVSASVAIEAAVMALLEMLFVVASTWLLVVNASWPVFAPISMMAFDTVPDVVCPLVASLRTASTMF